VWPKSESILVTGGAGFMGSHLIEKLLAAGNNVTVFDNLSSGTLESICSHADNSNFHFLKGDMLDDRALSRVVEDCRTVYHLAASADLKNAGIESGPYYSNNLTATHNLIKALSKNATCRRVIFTSSVLVYGDPEILPTPEIYGPLKPISYYGATKLGCEALLSAYSHISRTPVTILRIANVVGKGRTRGLALPSQL
jgi:UDP-glucose 4-epimerase